MPPPAVNHPFLLGHLPTPPADVLRVSRATAYLLLNRPSLAELMAGTAA